MILSGYGFDGGAGPVTAGWLPLGDLTILIGPNDSGKSRLLRQLEADLGGSVGGRPHRNALFFAELAGQAELESLLEATREVAGGIDPDFASLTARDSWLEYNRQLLRGRPEIGQLLDLLDSSTAVALERRREFVHGADRECLYVFWCGPAAADLGHDGRAWAASHHWALRLGLDQRAPSPIAQAGSLCWPLLPIPRRLPTGEATLLEDAISAISEWVIVMTLLGAIEDGDEKAVAAAQGHGIARHLRATAPPSRTWLRADADPPSRRPEVDLAFQILRRAAREARAPIVAQRYDVCIDPSPLVEWGSAGPVRVRLAEIAGPGQSVGRAAEYAISEVADGLHLWAEFAVSEAIDALRVMTSYVHYSLDSISELPRDQVRAFAQHIRTSGEMHPELGSAEALGLEERLAWRGVEELAWRERDEADGEAPRFGRPSLYLIDEPERHLSPRLVRETAQWLERWLSEHRSQGVIVSHAVGFLAADRARFVQVRRDDAGPMLKPFEASDLLQLRGVCEDLGFDRGELLGLARALLFVEGETDRAVLDVIFGPRLWRSGIVMASIGGTRNHAAAAEASVLLRYCDLPVVVVFDALDADLIYRLITDLSFRHESLRSSHTETQAMARLLDIAEENRRIVRPLPLEALDMFDLLDDEVLAGRFSGFPGHAAVNEQHGPEKPRRKEFWASLRDRYGIEKKVAIFREVAEEMRARGCVPPQLEALVSQAEAIAAEW